MHTTFNPLHQEPPFTAAAHSRSFRVAQANFYITNVCNLACDNCWSLNNLAVSGHLSWSHSQARVQQWARFLDIDSLSIVGGEPLLNPHLDTWVTQLRRLWPHTQQEFTIVTNGTQLQHWPPAVIHSWFEQGVALEISCHDPRHWPLLLQQCQQLLADLIEPLEIRLTLNQGVLAHNYCLSDGTRLITLAQHWQFHSSAVRALGQQGLEFWHSDANVAHSCCPVSRCHYFVNGVMHKCPVTAAAAAGIPQQFHMSSRAAQLLAQAQGCDPLTVTQLNTWFHSLDHTIPQCSLCPEHPQERRPIWPLPDRKPKVSRVNTERLQHGATDQQ